MESQTKNEHRLSSYIDVGEVALLIAGAIVVAGLLMEDGPSIWRAAVTRKWPAREVTGGLLVTLGVLLEVVIAFVIAQIAKRIDSIADAKVAEALERAAKAEKDAAEANLARAQIEQRMSARSLGVAERKELNELLLTVTGNTVDIVEFDHHVQETKLFGYQILGPFHAAKWKCRVWESRAATFRIPGASVLIVVAQGHVDQFGELAQSVSAILRKSGIDSDVRLGAFSAGKEFEPGDFHLELEDPPVYMGYRHVAPFRIQIGAKQLVPFPPTKIVTVRKA